MSTDDLQPVLEALSEESSAGKERSIDEQTVRQDKIASDAPQAWFQSDPNLAPIFIARENGMHIDHGALDQAPEQIDPISPLYTVVNRFPSASNELPTERVNSSTGEDSGPRIWRMKKATALKVVILVMLIVSAAIGGGVGGSVASRRKNKTSNRTAPIHSNTTNFPANTTRTVEMPFNVQTWATANFTGRSQIFYKSGYFHTSFPAKSYRWSPGKWNNSMRLCTMSFCQGDHQIGWWGTSEHDGSSFQPSWYGWQYGDGINIVCRNDFEDPGCPSNADASSFQTAPIIKTTITPTPTQTELSSSTSLRVGPVTTTTKAPLSVG